ncbi:hypothetical protein DL93DRAFT_1376349 [Clavulina sp. PMI_390]|nr:hypothetical protein DL93DRAFT_1376349 [Clavulina sp. PMI_390]
MSTQSHLKPAVRDAILHWFNHTSCPAHPDFVRSTKFAPRAKSVPAMRGAPHATLVGINGEMAEIIIPGIVSSADMTHYGQMANAPRIGDADISKIKRRVVIMMPDGVGPQVLERWLATMRGVQNVENKHAGRPLLAQGLPNTRATPRRADRSPLGNQIIWPLIRRNPENPQQLIVPCVNAVWVWNERLPDKQHSDDVFWSASSSSPTNDDDLNAAITAAREEGIMTAVDMPDPSQIMEAKLRTAINYEARPIDEVRVYDFNGEQVAFVDMPGVVTPGSAVVLVATVVMFLIGNTTTYQMRWREITVIDNDPWEEQPVSPQPSSSNPSSSTSTPRKRPADDGPTPPRPRGPLLFHSPSNSPSPAKRARYAPSNDPKGKGKAKALLDDLDNVLEESENKDDEAEDHSTSSSDLTDVDEANE